jgi:hypothetical protein
MESLTNNQQQLKAVEKLGVVSKVFCRAKRSDFNSDYSWLESQLKPEKSQLINQHYSYLGLHNC